MWSARTAVIAPSLAFLTLVPGQRADAQHADVVAAVSCDGRVSYTAFSWAGSVDDETTPGNEQTLSRTNMVVAISVSRDGGAFRPVNSEVTHRFDEENGFAFSDGFRLEDRLPETVRIRAVPAVPWANGANPGQARSTPTLQLGECPGSAGATAAPSTSEAGTSQSNSSATGPGWLLGPLTWLTGLGAVGGLVGLAIIRRRDQEHDARN